MILLDPPSPPGLSSTWRDMDLEKTQRCHLINQLINQSVFLAHWTQEWLLRDQTALGTTLVRTFNYSFLTLIFQQWHVAEWYTTHLYCSRIACLESSGWTIGRNLMLHLHELQRDASPLTVDEPHLSTQHLHGAVRPSSWDSMVSKQCHWIRCQTVRSRLPSKKHITEPTAFVDHVFLNWCHPWVLTIDVVSLMER